MAVVKKIEEVQPVQENPKPTFVPGKQYTWDGEKSTFSFSGNEFAVLYNGLAEFVNSPEVAKVIRVVDAYKVLHNAFVNGIEEGVVTELVPQVKTESSFNEQTGENIFRQSVENPAEPNL